MEREVKGLIEDVADEEAQIRRIGSFRVGNLTVDVPSLDIT